MTEQDYVEVRLEDQIKWYSDKSSACKTWHMRAEKFIIIASAFIPVLTLLHYYCNEPQCFLIKHTDVIVAILGAVTAIVAAFSKLSKLQENWLNYREVSETLKHEKYLFLAKAGPYRDTDDSFPILVERVENIISHENINWAEINRSKD